VQITAKGREFAEGVAERFAGDPTYVAYSVIRVVAGVLLMH
jgi:hypothetical protein